MQHPRCSLHEHSILSSSTLANFQCPDLTSGKFETKLPASVAQAALTDLANVILQAIANATSESFAALRRKLGARARTGVPSAEKPFFDVAVELSIPTVNINPPLEAIQGAITTAAKQVRAMFTSLAHGMYQYAVCDC